MTTRTITPIPSPVDIAGAAAFSPRRAARIAGVSYLVMFVLAIFANFMVRDGLFEPGDAAATVANITESIGLFRLGLVAFLLIFILDVVIAWALHVVFRDVNRDLSLAAAWFRLVYSVLLGIGLVSFFQVLFLVSGPVYLQADQINAQTMLAMESFESTWLIGLVAFGIHLVLIGVLIIRSGLVSKTLGFILIAAGVAYASDTLAHAALADYQAIAGVLLAAVAIPSMIGEGWLGLWLLLNRRVQNGHHTSRLPREEGEGRCELHCRASASRGSAGVRRNGGRVCEGRWCCPTRIGGLGFLAVCTHVEGGMARCDHS